MSEVCVYFGEVDVRRFDRFEELLNRIADQLEGPKDLVSYSAALDDIWNDTMCAYQNGELSRLDVARKFAKALHQLKTTKKGVLA